MVAGGNGYDEAMLVVRGRALEEGREGLLKKGTWTRDIARVVAAIQTYTLLHPPLPPPSFVISRS